MSNDELKSGVVYSQPIETPQTFKIVAVRKDDVGKIIAYKLDNNEIIDVEQAIAMCEIGQLEGYRVGVSRADTRFIRGVGDGDPSNNLDNLPGF